jgi:large subunit ribosomal protein L9
MELILRETIDTLGLEGDIVKVKPGYGRNYLIPNNLAVLVNKANLSKLAAQKDAIEARRLQSTNAAEALTKQLAGATITIEKRVGEEDKLYGSVTTSEIADKLAEAGIVIDRRKIILEEPIKTVGKKTITVKVGYQMTAELTIDIQPLAAQE